MIHWEIELLGAGIFLVDHPHKLGNIPDVLAHIINHLVYCQVTLVSRLRMVCYTYWLT
jgi:hypothetical protein